VVAIRNQREELPLDVLAARADLHPALVQRFVEFGLVQMIRRENVLLFDATVIPRLRLINRLWKDLGLNLQGVAVVLDLLDRLRALQRENESLRLRL
jgi:DNA-binding transcriptional MerR regulator